MTLSGECSEGESTEESGRSNPEGRVWPMYFYSLGAGKIEVGLKVQTFSYKMNKV